MKAKKHLGQNFLKSKVIVERIAASAGVVETDNVLEIGPGKGILTEALLKKAGKVFVVEKDPELIPSLCDKFKEELKNKKLVLIEGDILETDMQKLIKGPYKVVANIPYYITGEIMRAFLSSNHKPESMTLLVQKEVAKRIVANDKKESILSLSVKIFGEPRITEIVKRTMFTPAPNVDSAVIHISNISNQKLKGAGIEESRFFEIVKVGFAQKRKQLLGNLKSRNKGNLLEKFLSENNLPLTIRAEDIPVETWIKIVKILS
ncbi:MAG TPA: 16S rRNA (adenine(1518)-N(6)/adenine(1519)-N(6))-dimethyltransferase RsmA [Candidatus Paceibacterota bacterium]|nr:16S rRNA (adenine(1518)-N(6)/adenine(1519)-N(6))-dimethyltransferase RsmA [Candidatus Paceibacterota bacterium]